MKFNTFSFFALGFLAAADAQQLVQKRTVRMKNKVCTGEAFRVLDNTTKFNKVFRCKKKCLNTQACQQIGFEFDFAEGKKKTGTCHLYKVQSKVSSLGTSLFVGKFSS